MSYLPQPKLSNASFISEKEIIDNGNSYLFDFDYPFYSDVEADRIEFQKYFCRHYYTYEIGQETEGLFKSRLQAKLYDIMPRIKRIYETERLVFDPLSDYNEVRQYTTEDTGEQTNSVNSVRHDQTSSETAATSSQESKVYNNVTPQGELSDIDSGKYLSEYTSTPTENTSNDSSTGSSESTVENRGQDTIHNVQIHREEITGKRGQSSYMELIQQYRDLAVNINGMICKECHDMFMYIF